MRAVVQRVKDCSVRVAGRVCGHIEHGLLVYLGVGRQDSEQDLCYLVDKVVNLRIFPDKNDKMNLSVIDADGQVLVVSQFTVYGDTRRGRRPSYTAAADPEMARDFYRRFVEMIRKQGVPVQTGEFAALMEVRYTNFGPITILLDSKKSF